ncbi:glucose--fructose oxidoreductase precursor [mine drainage metagenome]|uniref:Glucose--fructose oxidoreductase n=1 Tax=mine drainage metagenome TaxID=410659 RepID=A0A1J5RYF9_9ZZZZ
MKKIKFAIVGCGRIAQRHAEQINAFGELVAVCDIVFPKAVSFADEFKVAAYKSIDDLLENETDVDVISICTPNGLHAQQSIKCLQSGFHVLVEKPMALSVDDCKAMMAAAEKAKKNLFVVKQNRFNPPVVAVKDSIEKNILGKIFSVQLNCFWNRNKNYYQDEWRGTKDLDGGTLFTQFSHFIDLLFWFFGDVETVCALTENFNHQDLIEFEDTGVVVLKFKNGIIGTMNYTVNSFKNNMEGSLTIFAEKGTVKIGGQYLNELEYQNIENFSFENLPKGNLANDYGNYVGSMSNHDKEYQNLIETVQSGKLNYSNTFDGMKTVEIIQKIYQSAK